MTDLPTAIMADCAEREENESSSLSAELLRSCSPSSKERERFFSQLHAFQRSYGEIFCAQQLSLCFHLCSKKDLFRSSLSRQFNGKFARQLKALSVGVVQRVHNFIVLRDFEISFFSTAF